MLGHGDQRPFAKIGRMCRLNHLQRAAKKNCNFFESFVYGIFFESFVKF
jgi:hypothetical protein